MQDPIHQILSAHPKKKVSLKDFKPSAVLAPLFIKEGEETLLFTVRNDRVRHHKGEVCFPGGVYDRSDHNLLNTALRECQEELGLQKQDIEILGELDDLITPTYYRITPFVGKIPHPYPLIVNAKEIAETIEVPLSFFLDETHLKEKTVEYFGESHQVPLYEWKGYPIWGATGRVVRQLVTLVRQARSGVSSVP